MFRRTTPRRPATSAHASSVLRDGARHIRIEHMGTVVPMRPADLFIVTKPHAKYQRINDFNGDPVTHIALADVEDDGVVTLEHGPAGFFSRRFDEFEKNYLGLAVVHLDLDDEQRTRVLAEARTSMREQPFRYTHAQCVGIGLYALVRKVTPRLFEPVVTAVALTLAAVAYVIHGGRRTTCSGALAQVFSVADVRLELALPSREPIAYRDRGDLAALRLRPRRLLPDRWRGPWTVVLSPSDLAVAVPSTGLSVVRAVPWHQPTDSSFGEPAASRDGPR